MNKKSILDAKFTGKRVVVRVDFNVAFDEGKIKDDTRIRETIPTLKYLLKENASLILLSHLGRPKGIDPKYSLKPVAKRLEQYLKQKVEFINQFNKKELVKLKNLLPGQVVMLENVRFHEGEEKNDLKYAKLLASFGEVFVNDAFAAAHRAHSSTVGITKYLPAYAGLLLIKEINIISKVLGNPDKPVVSVIGGAKISDKIGLIKKQLDLSQTVLVGGGIANTFLKAMGKNIGLSLVENEAVDFARELLYAAASKHSALILPFDFVTVDVRGKISPVAITEMKENMSIRDLGPKSRKLYKEYLLTAGTIIFNGPMGKYEEKPFDQATKDLITATARSKALSVIGGGDTLACIPNDKIAAEITHISTGGGAMLEFIEKGTLPAIEVLQNA
ncbi:phosphoglycerate kinase [Candidatus Gottesmanbacteria bacterium]|nr:phosphoglycerate kinase [Candidatus Gottesmanbacteria bacterium]